MDCDVLLKMLCGVNYDGLDCSVDVVIFCLCKKLLDSVVEFYCIKIICNKGYFFVFYVWDEMMG